MIKIIVAGFKGKMGSTSTKMVLENKKFELVGVVDPLTTKTNMTDYSEYENINVPIFNSKEEAINETQPDVWIDFTLPNVAFSHVKYAIEQGVRPVVGTTGFTDEQIEELQTLSKKEQIGGLIAPNFAIGAVLMMQFARQAARYFPDVEIIELHHDNKRDAPSGTGLKTAEMMAEVRPTHQQGHPEEEELMTGARGADFDGMRLHSVRLPGLIAHQEVLFGNTGEGLTIRHDSYDRSSFMTGVALGCEHVMNLNELIYGLEHLL